MHRTGVVCATRILTAILLLCSTHAFAQHHGGHGMGIGGYVPGRPDGVDERDTLKDFHQVLAVQATSQQVTEFQQLVKQTVAAKEMLASIVQGPAQRNAISSFDQALASARTANGKFQQGLSEAQKSGLKEILKRLAKSDADLQQESQRFEQGIQTELSSSELSNRAAGLDKILFSYAGDQLALGREMGITLASGQDEAFNLPPVQRTLTLNGATVPIGFTGELLQTAADAGMRTFHVNGLVDLSDLQQNISEAMRAQLNQNNRCGVRLSVQQASLGGIAPASSLFLRLHFERWSCSANYELAEGDGKVEIKLTPAVENSTFHIAAEWKKIDATGMLLDELRSGDLGDDLRDKVAKAMLAALQAGADIKSNFPAAAQGAMWQGVRFQAEGTGGLRSFLDGELRLSNDQVTALAGQLNQKLAAQQSATATQAGPSR